METIRVYRNGDLVNAKEFESKKRATDFFSAQCRLYLWMSQYHTIRSLHVTQTSEVDNFITEMWFVVN